jgi:hypothetical protein
VLEKLIEDWLTNVNELGYQLPFCEVLLAEGFTIVHVSTHGRGEHGKDIVARHPDGNLSTFQLKGGDIRLSDWRKIRAEVEELVQLPVRLPGIDERESHTPYLVTNGEIRGDALESIKRYSDTWQTQGHQELQIWSRRIVLKKFLDAQGSFLPGDLREFRRFVELYVGDFESPFPKSKFARLLEAIATKHLLRLEGRDVSRGIAALSLVAGYIVEQYQRAGNHIAAAEGWTMTASSVMYIAERANLKREDYEPTLSLLHSTLVRTLERFASEALQHDSFSSSRYGLADPHVYGVRVTLTLGWLSAWALDRKWRRCEQIETQSILKVLEREYPAHRLAGEADWPSIMCLALYLDREWMQPDAEAVIIRYANAILAANQAKEAKGVPSPYWSQEKVLRFVVGMLAPSAQEHFGRHSYTLLQALNMLVRRLRRQTVRVMWPPASKMIFCDFMPDNLADYFLWRCRKGNLHSEVPKRTASWSAWRFESSFLDQNLVPSLLVRHPEWTLPFLLTYPHRANRSLCALAEAVSNSYVKLSAPKSDGKHHNPPVRHRKGRKLKSHEPQGRSDRLPTSKGEEAP